MNTFTFTIAVCVAVRKPKPDLALAVPHSVHRAAVRRSYRNFDYLSLLFKRNLTFPDDKKEADEMIA